MKLTTKLRVRRLRRSSILLMLAFAFTGMYVVAAGGNFPLDDSWIHQTYGRNLGLLGEWAFFPGTPSAASTSPLYTVLLAIGYWLRIPVQFWTHGLGALALAITGILGAGIAERLSGRRIVGWAAGLAIVSSWHLIWAAASGMETALFAMLTMALIAYVMEYDQRVWHDGRIAMRPYRGFRAVVFGGLAGLTALARPEGVLLAGLCGLYALTMTLSRRQWGFAAVFVVCAGMGFAVVIAPYIAYNVDVTGGVLPNTASAKRAQADVLFALPFIERVGRMIVPLMAGGMVLLVPGLVGFVVKLHPLPPSPHGEGEKIGHDGGKTRRGQDSALQKDSGGGVGARWLIVAWGVGLIALYAAWLPLDMQHGRYVMPALPALIVAGVVGTGELAYRARRTLIGRVLVNALIVSSGVIFVIFALVIGRAAYVNDVAIIDGDMVAAALWIQENVPEDQLLAIHDIGAVGYFAPRPMLDIGGLVSPEVIPVIRNADALWALMESRGARWLMAYPYQTPGENAEDPRLCEVFSTDNAAARRAGGSPMMVYRISETGCNP